MIAGARGGKPLGGTVVEGRPPRRPRTRCTAKGCLRRRDDRLWSKPGNAKSRGASTESVDIRRGHPRPAAAAQVPGCCLPTFFLMDNDPRALRVTRAFGKPLAAGPGDRDRFRFVASLRLLRAFPGVERRQTWQAAAFRLRAWAPTSLRSPEQAHFTLVRLRASGYIPSSRLVNTRRMNWAAPATPCESFE